MKQLAPYLLSIAVTQSNFCPIPIDQSGAQLYCSGGYTTRQSNAMMIVGLNLSGFVLQPTTFQRRSLKLDALQYACPCSGDTAKVRKNVLVLSSRQRVHTLKLCPHGVLYESVDELVPCSIGVGLR